MPTCGVRQICPILASKDSDQRRPIGIAAINAQLKALSIVWAESGAPWVAERAPPTEMTTRETRGRKWFDRFQRRRQTISPTTNRPPVISSSSGQPARLFRPLGSPWTLNIDRYEAAFRTTGARDPSR